VLATRLRLSKAAFFRTCHSWQCHCSTGMSTLRRVGAGQGRCCAIGRCHCGALSSCIRTSYVCDLRMAWSDMRCGHVAVMRVLVPHPKRALRPQKAVATHHTDLGIPPAEELPNPTHWPLTAMYYGRQQPHVPRRGEAINHAERKAYQVHLTVTCCCHCHSVESQSLPRRSIPQRYPILPACTLITTPTRATDSLCSLAAR
jgi:hypothetical protein